jgi:hypothetical protein
MLRDLAPSAQKPTAELIDDPTDEQIAAFYAAARKPTASPSPSTKTPK